MSRVTFVLDQISGQLVNVATQVQQPNRYFNVDDSRTWIDKKINDVGVSSLEAVFKPLGDLIKNTFLYTVDFLNTYSVDVILTGIMGCSALMMITSLWGGGSGKWLGRIALISIVGTIWRMMI